MNNSIIMGTQSIRHNQLSNKPQQSKDTLWVGLREKTAQEGEFLVQNADPTKQVIHLKANIETVTELKNNLLKFMKKNSPKILYKIYPPKEFSRQEINYKSVIEETWLKLNSTLNEIECQSLQQKENQSLNVFLIYRGIEICVRNQSKQNSTLDNSSLELEEQLKLLKGENETLRQTSCTAHQLNLKVSLRPEN